MSGVRMLRLIKETRPLLLPWIVVSMLGATRSLTGNLSIGPVHITALTGIAAFIGIPLLAALPFSTEFQHQTLPLLLSQPVDRAKIWAEKVMVSVVFAAIAAAMYYLSWHTVWREDQSHQLTPPLIILAVC